MDAVPSTNLPCRKEEVPPDDIIGALQEILDDSPTLLKKAVRIPVIKKVVTADEVRGALQDFIDDSPGILTHTVRVPKPEKGA